VALYIDFYWEVLYASIASLSSAWWIWKRQWEHTGYLILAILLPLSVKVSLSFGDLYLPAEALIVVLAIVTLLRFLVPLNLTIIKKNPLPLLWLLSFIPGILMSVMPLVSLKFWVINGMFVFTFYYGFLHIASRGKHLPMVPFMIALVPVLLLGLAQFIKFDFNPVTISGLYKPFFYSHTMLGASLAIIAGYSWSQSKNQKYWRPIAVLVALLVVLTGSRAALWSVVFMLTIWALMHLPELWRWLLPVTLLVVYFSLFGTAKIQESISYNSFQSHDPQATLLEKSMSVTNIQTDASNMERLNRWVSALRMFEERPMFGFGPGSYQFTYIPFQEKSLENRLTVRNPDSPPPGSGGSAHSEILLQLSENGIATVLIFLVMIGRWVYFGFLRGTLRSPQTALFLALSTYLFHMQFNNFLNQPAFAFLFWGCAAYFDHQLRRNNHELLQ
jgi:putative inorganic carbon (hco3(-)) transporter